MTAREDAIVALTDAFCHAHLTEEYRQLCRQLTSVLARKQPSPLAENTPEAWACGIVKVIAWVNSVSTLAAIDTAFDVPSDIGQIKCKAIRALLKIGIFDTDWTLPSRLKKNPRIWAIPFASSVRTA
jgi:hypothetical protein